MKVKIAVNSKSQRSITLTPYEIEFKDFAKACSEPKEGGKYESYFVRGGELEITPADLDHKNPECHKDHYHRNDKSLLSADVIILDCDGSIEDESSAPDGKLIHKILKSLEYTHFIYSTHSHKMPGKGNRYRAVMPCKMQNKFELHATVNKLMTQIRKAGCPLGDVKEARAWSQAWFFPTRDNPDDNLFEYYEYLDGKAVSVVEVDFNLINNLEKRKNEQRNRKSKHGIAKSSQKYLLKIIKTGGEGLHHAINSFLYGQIKDGVNKTVAIENLKALMDSNPNKDERWQQRYDEIERSADGAEKLIKEEEYSEQNIVSEGEDAKQILSLDEIELRLPEYPYDLMEDWPEPWPQIWDNWKRFPAVLNQPLLVPIILAFHGYMLNGKYINVRGRRPNMYFLNLAESTGHKDTNSNDVIRDMPLAMGEHGMFNTIFDEMIHGDSSISSDIAFLQNLEHKNSKMFWINTEATRVFQQLSGSGSINSSVAALADKIIEVVDGKVITGKSKAKDGVRSVINPNVQIIFYAQPETIEKFIDEDMVDSGFLGRALITLDVDGIMEKHKGKSIFDEYEHHRARTLDDDIAGFYGNCQLINQELIKKETIRITGKNLEIAKQFETEFLMPLLEKGENNEDHQKYLYKMLTRMGNSTEQLYSIIVGVCKQWDEWQGNQTRETEEIPIDGLIPLIKFWSEVKYYVVNKYIDISKEPVIDAIKEQIHLILSNKTFITNGKYNSPNEKIVADFIKKGYIPKSKLVNMVRSSKKAKQSKIAEIFGPTEAVKKGLQTLIDCDVISEVSFKIGSSHKETNFVILKK